MGMISAMTPNTALFTRSSLGFVRAAVVTPELRVADVTFNTRATLSALEKASALGSQIAVFPELGLTGYTCGDLFYQSLLISQARNALTTIAEATANLQLLAVVGLPLHVDGRLYKHGGCRRRRAGTGNHTQDVSAHHQ